MIYNKIVQDVKKLEVNDKTFDTIKTDSIIAFI